MVYLEYFKDGYWRKVGAFVNECLAWNSIGLVKIDYRTTSINGNVLTDRRK
jgi:hypothetical protein